MQNIEQTRPVADSANARAATVLIVEDEPLPRLALSDFLQEKGFKVYEARSTKEAIGILEAPDAAIDAVFADIQLPGVINGLGLATWLRGKRPDIKIVMTSGYSGRAESVQKTFWINAPFIEKPYDLAHVERVLRKALDS